MSLPRYTAAVRVRPNLYFEASEYQQTEAEAVERRHFRVATVFSGTVDYRFSPPTGWSLRTEVGTAGGALDLVVAVQILARSTLSRALIGRRFTQDFGSSAQSRGSRRGMRARGERLDGIAHAAKLKTLELSMTPQASRSPHHPHALHAAPILSPK